MSQVHASNHKNMTRIVIIGGGAAGIDAAQALARKLTPADNTEVLLLEKSAYYYHVVGAPRAYVDANYTNKMFIPYDNAIPKSAATFVRIVRGEAIAISAETNEVSYRAIGRDDKDSGDTEKLQFDYLVLATGSTYSVPIKQDRQDFARSATEAKLQEVRSHIENADKVVVVGGGSVGCEVAAEIKVKYPSKTVTIIEAHNQLISGNNLTDKFYTRLNLSLGKSGVKVILGERLTERLSGNGLEKRTLRTNKGTEIESDIQLLCGGFTPVANLVEGMDSSLVTDHGAVKVNGQLQLEGDRFGHMFAIGDVCNHPSPKMAFIAGEQAKFLATELVAVIRKKQLGFNKPFRAPGTAAMILPLGPLGGVSQLPIFGGIVVGNWFTRAIKSKDYLASMMWSSIGATAPK
ncbi:Apoptosis-inducing factor 2 [Phytophthora pseudosyringae]|uniref:Apoptosis-inducing factor 2 n=1 Tax=Phytophthora pseudosyringae TaxID=221518 RepID=A0A8T1VUM3_9STRA|nr:Apoptosis-inducing factor 2 [Phytophthora pseudosyringae]